ncbi:MAG: trypsin-like peptidase domain-containing protein, partial [Bacteroidales bacterium]|nr:trypsin-like peptidase domain-containing protein [Bacteroidales bacterium]
MKTMNLVSSPARKLTSLLIVLSLIQLTSFAQVKELSRHYENYSWSSSDAPESVNASHVIEINGATWLRLHFDEVNLKAGSYLKVKSLEDGGTQKLNAKQLKLWHNSTAYFNGNKVEVTLHKSANDPDASIKIIQIEVGDPEPESICGSSDDRKASNDKAVGRLVPIGCTGWIIKNGKIVTAGHCAKSTMQVLEFNIPKSSSNGSIKHPAPEHQYTVNQGSIVKGSASSQGTDWAVFKVANNSKTGKSPIQAQGKSFNVVQVNKVKNVRITGCGVDNGSANQTQQTHVGPYSSSNSNKIYYVTDTRGGNSGSPVIDAATGNAIGVHTHGGCSYSGGANSGTNARRADFWKAMGLGSTPPADKLNDIKDLK